jgi:DNA-binding transcriptional LysR family regulator
MAVELRLLRALVVLAEHGNVGRAATALHLTQPALSKQIAQLERALGLQLFRRHPQGVTPTDAGRLLVDRAHHVLREADEFTLLARRARRAAAGRLHLGFVGQALNEHTPRLLRAFREHHPDVRVELRQYGMTDLSAGLTDGSADLAILRQPVGFPDLVHEPVLVEPRVAVLPDDHPLAARDHVRLAELFGEPWVVSTSSDPVYQRFALALDARGDTSPLLGPTVRSIDEYLEVVLDHQGIGLAPASAARYYARPGITYVPVPDAQPSTATLSWSARRPPTPTALAMIELIRSRLPFTGTDG